ncbi:MAG: MFS transporter [Actinomycetales bacterium]
MTWAAYREVLSDRRVAVLLLLGIFVRVPAAGGLAMTFYVVESLDRSYAAAGLVMTALTIGHALGAPWRGRRVDQVGLRPALRAPILVETVGYAVASVAGYWPLAILAFVIGIFTLPSFSAIRQALVAAVPVERRRTVLSLDSIGVELTFMTAPALVAWVATSYSPGVALRGLAVTACVAGVALYAYNPALVGEGEDATVAGAADPRAWVSARLVAALVVCTGAAIVLFGTDVSIFARLRELDALPQTGIVFAVWSVGSILGALVYGQLRSPPSPAWLLLGLAVCTAPLALMHSVPAMSAAVLVAGFLCAPVIVATAEVVTEAAPANRRGTALGWHGSALTTGGAVAGPYAGVMMDRFGAGAGPVAVAVVGGVLAVAGFALVARSASRVILPEASAEQ